MSEVSEDRDVISFPDPCFLSATSLEVCGPGVKNLWGPCHSLHPASRRGMRAGRPHLLKSLSPKVTHMIYSQVLWVKLVIWPGVLGNVVLHLVAASPKQLFATLSHMAFAIEILSYVTWNEVLQVDLTIVQSSVMLPHRLVFFPSAWWCFSLGLVTSGPQVGCCMCPQTPRTKGNERPPPGNAPCASLSFIRKQKIFPETSLEDFLCHLIGQDCHLASSNCNGSWKLKCLGRGLEQSSLAEISGWAHCYLAKKKGT